MDREKLDEFRLMVYVVDKGMDFKIGLVEVIVQVVDLNDNVLEFVNDNLDFNVFENFGCNVMVGVLLVYDSDSGENN